MKHLQDISLVVVGFLTFTPIGYFIHTLANYNYCTRGELDCVSVRRDSSGATPKSAILKYAQTCQAMKC